MRILIAVATLMLSATLVIAADTRATLEAELHAFNDRFNTLSANRDTEGLVALYADHSLWIAPETPPEPGQELARKNFGFLVENAGSLVHTVEELILSQDGTQAVMIGDAIIKVEKAGLDFVGTYLFVMQRDADGWEIIADMFNRHAQD